MHHSLTTLNAKKGLLSCQNFIWICTDAKRYASRNANAERDIVFDSDVVKECLEKVNSMSAADLRNATSLSERIARNIVSVRTKSGSFLSMADIERATGLKPHVIQRAFVRLVDSQPCNEFNDVHAKFSIAYSKISPRFTADEVYMSMYVNKMVCSLYL